MAEMTKKEFIQQCVIHGCITIPYGLELWDEIEHMFKTDKPKPKQIDHTIEYYDIKIPTNKNDEYYSPEMTQVSGWVECYQAIDVDYQLKAIKTWSKANQTKRKTRDGMNRFINTWLSKAQNNPSQHKDAVKIVQKPERKSDKQKQKELLNQKIRELFGGVRTYQKNNQFKLIQPLQAEIEVLKEELRKLESSNENDSI